MCITFLFLNNPNDECSKSKYKLILINNRDEFYARKTQNASVMEIEGSDKKSIYGVDLAGAVKGTWLGISKEKNRIKVGNLANVTGTDHKGKRGRGPIVTDWINSNLEILDHNQELFKIAQEFSSFNFLSIDLNNDKIDATYTSNSPKAHQKLPYGCTGLGNSPMCRPFQKVEKGVEMFAGIIEATKDLTKEEQIDAFRKLLQSEIQHFPDDELTNRKQEEDPVRFSSIHIELKDFGYGTRTRTIILIDENNAIDYIEDTMVTTDPYGEWMTTHLKLP